MRSSLPTSHGFLPLSDKHSIPNPLPVSPEKSAFVNQFDFVGTIDSAPYLCVPAALQFRRNVCGGEERIMEYCARLAHDAGKLVADALQTEVLDNSTRTLSRCCFANVRLPLEVGTDRTKGQIPHEDIAPATKYMSQIFVDDYNTFIAVFPYAGNWWVRLSAQVYLELKDFEWCARVLKEVCGKVRRREYLGKIKL
jgi:hercynylcysteine S-oxide lyase